MDKEEVTPEDFRYMRSSPSRIPSFARFFNATRHPATLIWIDYAGRGVVYTQELESWKHLDVTSFAGHKWVFMRSNTDERLVVDNKSVWIGEPWTNNCGSSPNKAKRKLVVLRTPMHSLKQCCVITIKRKLKENGQSASGLPTLPNNLAEDLTHSFYRYLMPFTKSAPPPVSQRAPPDDV